MYFEQSISYLSTLFRAESSVRVHKSLTFFSLLIVFLSGAADRGTHHVPAGVGGAGRVRRAPLRPQGLRAARHRAQHHRLPRRCREYFSTLLLCWRCSTHSL